MDVLLDLALAAPATAAYRSLYSTVPEAKFPDVVWDSVLMAMAMRHCWTDAAWRQ